MQKTENIDAEAMQSFVLQVAVPGLSTCQLANTILSRFEAIEKATAEGIANGDKVQVDATKAVAAFSYRVGKQLQEVGQKLIANAENLADLAGIDEDFEGQPRDVLFRLANGSKTLQKLAFMVPAIQSRQDSLIGVILGDI